jgi:hypothetical protein
VKIFPKFFSPPVKGAKLENLRRVLFHPHPRNNRQRGIFRDFDELRNGGKITSAFDSHKEATHAANSFSQWEHGAMPRELLSYCRKH